ncbi:hypothetical protein [Neodiprion sertifer nucleopolyhedrovirus]|uniref:DRBM domain-containing protein n=1 Tax=Neodiprion sertifer nucleopolyhedrovirus TaxID=111874 RepID=Q6JKA9_9CBAC|nr:hypothetical protein NeseNPV_gp51 [Neodiprion sertifer nucleopolyhedrovirus]AAQ96428.1 hypothetical protein [Neodiprion sertifer nucleopolyhedrovirus]
MSNSFINDNDISQLYSITRSESQSLLKTDVYLNDNIFIVTLVYENTITRGSAKRCKEAKDIAAKNMLHIFNVNRTDDLQNYHILQNYIIHKHQPCVTFVYFDNKWYCQLLYNDWCAHGFGVSKIDAKTHACKHMLNIINENK